MWELNCEEGWAPKNWCFWTVVLKKTLESPLDCKEIQPVHSEGDQPWDFFGRTDAKAETPVLWPPHEESWLIGKDFDAGKDWGQEENGMTEDEMAGWHHWLDGHESEWTPGVGDGQGGLACCDSWGHKESVTTERLNWTELITDRRCNKIGAQKELKIVVEFKQERIHLLAGIRIWLIGTAAISVGPCRWVEDNSGKKYWSYILKILNISLKNDYVVKESYIFFSMLLNSWLRTTNSHNKRQITEEKQAET